MRNLQRSICLCILLMTVCFAKAQTITITKPNGGEVLYPCQDYTITWTQTGAPSNYWNIDYSIDGGTIWASVATNYLSTNGQFVWTVPNVTTSTALIRVYDAQNPATTDQSNAVFSIRKAVTVTSPNGGETLTGNSVYNITWDAIPGGTTPFTISYSLNGGSTWTYLVYDHDASSRSYAWTVPTIALNANCLVRVGYYVQSCTQDVSDAVFTITPPTPLLTYPNGGQTVQPGCVLTISWLTSTLYTTARIDYSSDGGTTWNLITNAASNNGAYNWTVPATTPPSNNWLIRICNTNNVGLYDVSNATFNIAVPVTVTSFNTGGTVTGCGTATISWTKSTCIGSWYIYYSENNGATYTMIGSVSDNGLTTQNYTWSVPNGINSTTAKIKVVNVSNPDIFDENEGNFTINASNDITVTSPNGGETLPGLSTQNITWTNLPTSSGQYNIHYSINNGTTWTTIATNVTGNAYAWSVPNINAPSCLVRVQDYSNTCKFDVSNASFAIAPATPLLTYPNGGQTFQLGCVYNITWLTSTLYTNARLDYSVDNGTTWTQIVSSTSNSGSYPWTVPATLPISDQCLIRISNAGNLALNDVSNAPFSIGVPVTVTSYNTGGTLIGCGTATITWTKSPCIGGWYIYYSADNGASYDMIAVPSDNGLANQSYTWSVPNGISTTAGKFKVTNANNLAIYDENEGNFTIIPSNDITVTSPNGGETFIGTTTQAITWTNLPTASGQYNIQYSINGTTWSSIANNITGNTYNWTVPNINAPTVRIRVQDYLNTCKFDTSNASFAISPVTPVLTSPNSAATVWQLGCAYNITWLTSTLYTTAKIDYSTDNGVTWTQIVSAATNNGSYAWTVPGTLAPSTQCLIRISNTGNLALNDVSNNPFTIDIPVRVTSFNNGGTLVDCGTATITWSKTPCLGNWYIYYSEDNGASYDMIAVPSDNGLATQSYTWSVPNGINTSTAKFKVTSAYNLAFFDESDGNFSIIPSNDITVTSPNGGETFIGTTTQAITWTNLPTASGQYNIHYSINGTTWSTIASNVTGNTYNWTVPNINAPSVRIRVQDYLNTCKFDTGDARFAISPVQPILTSPNSASTVWQLNCAYNITWLTSSLYTTAKIDYSTDNGVTWTQIVNAATNNGSYSWTVPATFTPTTQFLIRLSNTGNLALTDVSNNPFTIDVPVTVNSFNNGGTAVGCGTASISFTKSPCLGSSWYIYYSVDNGSYYSYAGYVTDNGSNTQTYTWQVPNEVSSTTAKIRVTHSYYSNVTDESEGNFTIIPSNDITVTSPNGGEVLTALTPYTITWTNQPTASGQYTLRYTNGTTYTTIATNITGNSYVWTPPNAAAASTYKIRVIDYVNSCKYDESDATFTVNPTTPVLTSPNATQTWQMGCAYNITWNTATLYTTARLDYTLDGGTTWTNITTAATNNGSYSWTVPVGISNISSNCLIRISNTGNLALNDVSNNPFSIGVPITVNSFNSGGSVIGCSTVPISFTKSPCIVTTWYLWYSANNGTNWSLIGSATENGLATQTYNWLVPNDVNTTTAKIRVSSLSVPGIEDESEGNFSITPSNDITVTSANGGESWQGLSTKLITWSNLAGASGQYTIRYSVNNGTNWTTIASNITGNAYNWTVPNLSSTQCLIRVIDYVNTCKFDNSDAVFTIVPATPVLTAPNGGQSWYAGTTNNITWNTASLYTTTVRLDYSVDNGNNWINIATSATNNGAYSWVAPLENSTNCLVRISNFGDLPVNDVSDAVFTIKPAVTILTPNGGEQVNNIGGCTVTSITFDHSPAFTTFYLEYTLNDGISWSPITTNFSATANPATYNWSVPNRSSTQARVRVRPTANSYTDASDAVFPIIKAVTLIQPNFGGIMQAGTSYEIIWSSDGISSVYDLFYTTNGSTYTNIVTGYNTSTNKYTWTVPNIPSTNCRIMIRDNINTCKTDTSDMTFIISTTAAPITLVTPNGIADTVNACGNYNITWTETSAIGNYNIDYSLNGGTTWVSIVSNYATNSGSYTWAVPTGIATNQALIRISAASNATVFDLSNAYFVIAQPTYTFTGNGNWSNPANWANNSMPPANPPSCTQIIIDNQAGGECIMDVPYSLPAGASFIVRPGKRITIAGSLNIQ